MAKINKEYVNSFFDNLDSSSDKEIKYFVENINKEPVSFLNTIFNLYLEDLTKDNILTKLNVFIFISKNNIKINLNNCIELININKSLKEMLSLIDYNNIMTNIKNNILKIFIDAYLILNREEDEEKEFDIDDNNYQGSKLYMNEISKYPLLTDEQVKNYASASYIIFKKTEDGYFTPIYSSTNAKLGNDGVVRTNVSNNLIKVIDKREHYSRSHHNHNGHMHTHHSTTYYITFEVESGDRMELKVKSYDYGMLVEGDYGVLSFQGTRYLGFERKYNEQ